MNISQKQLEANRKNAQKGGVKSLEGKAISKYNAMKHGILSKEVLLEGEDETALISLGKALRVELAPFSEIERVLVERIISNTWRLRRVIKIEREMLEHDKKSSSWLGKEERSLGEAVQIDFVNRDTYGKLIRYEASIEKGIYKALHELQRIQSARSGGNVPPPVAIDIDVSGEE